MMKLPLVRPSLSCNGGGGRLRTRPSKMKMSLGRDGSCVVEYFTRTFISVMVELRWLVDEVHDILLNQTVEGICYVFLMLQLIAVKIIGKRCEAEVEK